MTEVRAPHAQNRFPAISSIPSPRMTEVRLLLLAKAYSPMLSTLLGIVIEVRSQSLKAFLPMLVIPSSKLTEERLLQLSKALLPIVFKVPEILIDVRGQR